MTAGAVNPFDASPVSALPPETTPAAIRDALVDEERAEFERAYRQALAEGAETLDLTTVLGLRRIGGCWAKPLRSCPPVRTPMLCRSRTSGR